MSKILKSIVGLAIISSSIGLAAAPAHAESKALQCRRLYQGVTTFGQHSASNVPSNNTLADLDQYLASSEKALKALRNQQFNDPKIRGYHQRLLNLFVAVHNSTADIGDHIQARNLDAALADRQRLTKTLPAAGQKLGQEIRIYCGL
jgi:hypothetical protein